jgi:hypothetical protein
MEIVGMGRNVLCRCGGLPLCAGLLLTIASSTGAVADYRCAQLEALNRQYAGVQLTSAQKQIKVQLVAWYKKNCRAIRSADAQR